MCYILPPSVVYPMDYSTNSGAKFMLVGNCVCAHVYIIIIMYF